VVIPFRQPVEVALPVLSLGVWQMTTGGRTCPVTKLENLLRSYVGWKPIRGFVGHYYIKPVRKVLRKRTSMTQGLEHQHA
jgi:hypothetical protein